jgi:subtilisin family serine protease
MQTISAKELDPTRPKYLIIFEEAQEKNTSTLSSVLKRGKEEGAPEREGMSFLAAGESGVHVKVYEGLGVAAADLTKSQHDTLEKRSDVLAIVENEVRFLPPVTKSTEETPTDSTGQAAPIVAYLQGLRDAANMALAFQQGGQPISTSSIAAQSAVSVAAVPRFTWGLKALGIANAINPPTGKGVKVAVLDTGIDLNHPDLRGKVIDGDTAFSQVGGISVQDVHGHGTHCAGVICGPKLSASGIRYGVAPDCELLVGKVFNNNFRPTASDDDILDGITWAEQKGARVISMSLGSVRLKNGNFPLQYEQIARKLLTRDTNSVLLIAAAGNESRRPISTAPVGNPASCPSIMSVAAIDRFKNIAGFSCCQMDNIGEVDVSAPGVSVFSSFVNGTFEKLNGTTPHVAGLAALYLERDPNLTAQNLFDLLKSKAMPIGAKADFGSGLVRL